jgi:diadenosine tetraphosphate (Ap4A) HIT family hydrolase
MILDSRLEGDSYYITDLALCQVRLHHNAAFPWVLLTPQRPSLCEIIDLTPEDQHTLMQEIAFVSQIMRQVFEPKKLNIAALGNIVPQLHIHIIARYETDAAWPHPVWNSGITSAYTDPEKQEKIGLLKKAFAKTL